MQENIDWSTIAWKSISAGGWSIFRALPNQPSCVEKAMHCGVFYEMTLLSERIENAFGKDWEWFWPKWTVDHRARKSWGRIQNAKTTTQGCWDWNGLLVLKEIYHLTKKEKSKKELQETSKKKLNSRKGLKALSSCAFSSKSSQRIPSGFSFKRYRMKHNGSISQKSPWLQEVYHFQWKQNEFTSSQKCLAGRKYEDVSYKYHGDAEYVAEMDRGKFAELVEGK